jgi:hypothetical protein
MMVLVELPLLVLLRDIGFGKAAYKIKLRKRVRSTKAK